MSETDYKDIKTMEGKKPINDHNYNPHLWAVKQLSHLAIIVAWTVDMGP